MSDLERRTGAIGVKRGIQHASDISVNIVNRLRNFIIDPHFTQFPEGTVTANTSSGTTGVYGPALWAFRENALDNYAADMEQSTDIPSSESGGSSFFVDVTTAETAPAVDEYGVFEYKITGTDYSLLHGKPITFGFWHAHITTGTHWGYFQNSAKDISYVFSYEQDTTDTWQFSEVTLTLDTTGTWLFGPDEIGLRVGFTPIGGTNYQSSPSNNIWAPGEFYMGTTSVNVATDLKFYRPRLYLAPVADTFYLPTQQQTNEEVEYYIQRTDFEQTGQFITPVIVTPDDDFFVDYTFRRELRVAPTATHAVPGAFRAIQISGGIVGYTVISITMSEISTTGMELKMFVTAASISNLSTGYLTRDNTDTCFFQFDSRHYG